MRGHTDDILDISREKEKEREENGEYLLFYFAGGAISLAGENGVVSKNRVARSASETSPGRDHAERRKREKSEEP